MLQVSASTTQYCLLDRILPLLCLSLHRPRNGLPLKPFCRNHHQNCFKELCQAQALELLRESGNMTAVTVFLCIFPMLSEDVWWEGRSYTNTSTIPDQLLRFPHPTICGKHVFDKLLTLVLNKGTGTFFGNDVAQGIHCQGCPGDRFVRLNFLQKFYRRISIIFSNIFLNFGNFFIYFKS